MDCKDCDLVKANLSGANLWLANLTRTNLRRADLTGAAAGQTCHLKEGNKTTP